MHSPRRVSRSPLAVAIVISVGFHLLLVALLLFARVPAETPAMMKRGEPLFVELPEADRAAERGAPAAPSPAPKVQPTPPARPAVRPQPPQPSPREARPTPPRAPERTAAVTPPPRPAAPEPPAPDGTQPTPPAAKPAEPMVNEPERAPEPAHAPESPPHEASPPQPRVAAVPPRPPMIDSRALLRRGGPGSGGAGGSGEGWAGIEGEPIPLDSSDPKYNDYLERVRRMIKEKWGYPCIKDIATGHCDYKSARLVIVFGILRDGRVPVLAVAQQSGYPIYDDYAANAIRLAQPFPPVPASLMQMANSGSQGVKIVAAFQYMLVESSLTNILR